MKKIEVKIQKKAKIAVAYGKDVLKNNDGLQLLWPGFAILLVSLGGLLFLLLKIGHLI